MYTFKKYLIYVSFKMCVNSQKIMRVNINIKTIIIKKINYSCGPSILTYLVAYSWNLVA